MAQSDYIPQQRRHSATARIDGRDALGREARAVLIDVARAELIDHDALVEALASGRLGGLGLDVGYTEPADPNEPLLRHRAGNVILMPHTAIGSRANALHDVETLCLNLWRGVTRTLTA
jgi:phosphoglycerate dehydrogenase-like enzyme